MRSIKVAVGEMSGRLGDTAGNIAEACELSARAAKQGARLIVLPEGCLTGNARSDAARQDALPTDPEALRPLIRTASAHGISICPGFATRCDGGFNIVQAAIRPSGEVLFQHKAFRADTEPPFLVAWPDPARVVFDVDGVRVVIVICSEYASPAVQARVAELAPDLVLHPSAGCMQRGQLQEEGAPPSNEARDFDAQCRRVVERAAAQMKSAGVAKIGANPLGFDGETWWPGNSYGLDATGAVRLWLPGENRPARMKIRVAVAEMSFP